MLAASTKECSVGRPWGASNPYLSQAPTLYWAGQPPDSHCKARGGPAGVHGLGFREPGEALVSMSCGGC